MSTDQVPHGPGRKAATSSLLEKVGDRGRAGAAGDARRVFFSKPPGLCSVRLLGNTHFREKHPTHTHVAGGRHGACPGNSESTRLSPWRAVRAAPSAS